MYLNYGGESENLSHKRNLVMSRIKCITYKTQLIIFVLWIFCVMGLFKFIPDRQVAALFTGGGFIILPTLFLISEFKSEKNKFYIFVLSLFLIFSALPIFLLRVLNWGVEFASLDLFGIPASIMHKYSNYLYILMIFAVIYRIYKTRKKSH